MESSHSIRSCSIFVVLGVLLVMHEPKTKGNQRESPLGGGLFGGYLKPYRITGIDSAALWGSVISVRSEESPLCT